MRWCLGGLAVATGLLGCAATDDADPTGPGGAGGKADTTADRRVLVQSELEDWNANISDEARAEKFAAMSEGVFPFYRGSNHLYWMDLAGDPRLGEFGGADTEIWLQGDLHANNFGAFANDQGIVVFDLNDFDEVLVADYQLDVWRMAASLVLLGRENDLGDGEIGAAVDAFGEAYLDAVAAFDGNDDEVDFAIDRSNAFGRLDEFLAEVEQSESRRKMLDKWTTVVDGVQTLDTSIEDLAELDPQTADAIVTALDAYGATLSGGLDFDPAYFAAKGVAARLHAGVGSLGTPRFYVLIEGPSDGDDDDVILDIKRQGNPTGLAYLGDEARQRHDAVASNPGERIAIGNKALATAVDDHLGWLELDDGTYSVRERNPFKESFPTDELDSETRLVKLSEQWGMILASAHCRADQDHRPEIIDHSFDAAVDARTDGAHDGFRKVLREVAFDYAEQVAVDFEFFLEML